MVKYCYIVAEGPQDIEFLIRLLKFYNLRRVTRLSALDPFWEPLVPKTFPVDDDLMKRVPVPTFLENSELSIALHSAVGITRLANTVEESLALISSAEIFSVGFVLDADSNETPSARFNALINEIQSIALPLPSALGKVTNTSPRCGIFIMPNNLVAGTLEDILLECAKLNYPDLLQLALNYVSSIDQSQLSKDDLRELNKPSGKNKAVISIISSILKPGRTLQVSIQDNRWIDETTLMIESVNLVKTFLDEILGIV
ncbi:hypothetical protein H6G80_02320 [Nostoc sp. FACHB-87]|uniref:DUF3226 domain-containing protein n=1 Tax=Nostocales TaxID=1161 RepID=UPI0016857A51|nr:MULTISPECIES: DUF3226 domain-containing protein [Nostocales]MBD2452935.1 hypothetical protein [Nostoc sp. FACHB-87]MBD2474883.1 hypothetical protein [Anabaena sp. FACHB-83]MBD2488225.1 hypothetical protein [Aulosira sp. FACHB-615]